VLSGEEYGSEEEHLIADGTSPEMAKLRLKMEELRQQERAAARRRAGDESKKRQRQPSHHTDKRKRADTSARSEPRSRRDRGDGMLRRMRSELSLARREGRRKDVLYYLAEIEELEELEDDVADTATSSQVRDTARELLDMMTRQWQHGLPTAAGATDASPLKRARPLSGVKKRADEAYNTGTLTEADNQRLLKREYICYGWVAAECSPSAAFNRTKRKVELAEGVQITVDRKSGRDADEDDVGIFSMNMTYLVWDQAAKLVEEAMYRQRPDEHDGFMKHQQRCRNYARMYRMTAPQGYLRYDVLVRKMAARIQTGRDAQPFEWAEKAENIFGTIFNGVRCGLCETCGSPDHFGDGHAAAMRKKKKVLSHTGEDDEAYEAPAVVKDRKKKKKPTEKTTPPTKCCWDWNNGKCTRGGDCKFKHGICRACGLNHRWTNTSCTKYDKAKVEAAVAAAQ
jgi:hypothetical protein